jgi:hypothetical protein
MYWPAGHNLLPAPADFLLRLFFTLEDGGCIFLQNIVMSADYTLLQLRRPHPLFQGNIYASDSMLFG